eukprot:TRINITY_DN38301_c0_g1_i1.p1 TRINITY_DN38301_c0_g1~~TRINITY_DN38301_c0_g1_i1.p1  ORF type:complete len:141 (-),score=29.70 TRINITY_DN38301_c0_g1_i1:71-493(-)
MAFNVESRQGNAEGKTLVSIGQIAGFAVGQEGGLYSLDFDACCCVIVHNDEIGAFIHVEPWQQANDPKIKNTDADKGNKTFEQMWQRVPTGERKVILIYAEEPNKLLMEQAKKEGWQLHKVSAGKFSVQYDCKKGIKIGE